MNTPSFKSLACGLAVLLASGCSRPAPVADQAAVAPAATTPAPTAKPVADVGTPLKLVTDTTSPSWDQIRSLTFDRRAEFIAGLDKIDAWLDLQIGALNAKRATMTTDTADWDFAMKEVNASRASLKWLDTELANATAETWGQEKDMVEQALRRAEEACEKVKTTTTS